MLLCHCRAVSDRAIRKAIAHGARCSDDVARLCGAGADCGGCRQGIDDLLGHTEPAGVAPDARRTA